MWLGGSDQTTNSGWGWSDGKPFLYINWEGIEQHTEKTFKCVAMKLDTKTWHSVPCNVKMSYMCKKRSKYMNLYQYDLSFMQA